MNLSTHLRENVLHFTEMHIWGIYTPQHVKHVVYNLKHFQLNKYTPKKHEINQCV